MGKKEAATEEPKKSAKSSVKDPEKVKKAKKKKRAAGEKVTPPTEDAPPAKKKKSKKGAEGKESSKESKKPKKSKSKEVALMGADTAVLKEALKYEPKAACEEAANLAINIGKSRVKLAALLYVINEKRHYKAAGFTRFREFCEATFKLSVRVVYGCVEWYKTLLLEHNQDAEKVEMLGDTKAKTLTKALKDGLISAKSLPKKVDKALTLTDSELKEFLYRNRGSGEGEGGVTSDAPKDPALNISARLVGKEAINLWQQVGQILGNTHKKDLSGAEMLNFLCLEFMSSNFKSVTNETEALQQFLTSLQNHFPERKVFAIHKKYAKRVSQFVKQLQDEDKGKKHTSQGKHPTIPAEKE